jgi:glycerol-3-phosphate dehydrogenase
LPYGEFTLVGTTDMPVEAPEEAVIGNEEIDYLCAAANAYFLRQTTVADLVWSYSGVRSLYDDGAESAQAVTRDYHLELDDDPGAKLLSVFGGKITTARALAEEALDLLKVEGAKVTDSTALPGGDIGPAFNLWLGDLCGWMPQPLVRRLAEGYGTRLKLVLNDASRLEDLGRHFGAGLYEAEVRHLLEHEFARTSEDILWRRTKLGLRVSEAEKQALEAYLA